MVRPTLCFALFFESEPFINYFRAKRINYYKHFYHYSNNDIDILISGIGKFQMASAVSWLNTLQPANRLWINIGFAGSAVLSCYRYFIIHTINEQGNDRLHHTEILLKNNIPLASCITVNKPATTDFLKSCNYDLADMEAIGFYMAAKNFSPITQIQLIKIVSDNGADNEIDLKILYQQYIELIDEILCLINQWIEFFNKNRSNEVTLNYSEVEQLIQKLHLTYSQQNILNNALHLCKLYNFWPIRLNDFIRIIPEKLNKTERNKLFDNLIKQLQIE
jgi:hypothetical protein